jgi:uncharacterized Tic20 family protein
MSEATPAPQPAAPLTPTEDNQWASFAHLGGILGLLPSLIIWLIFKDRGAFTNTEAKEALNFQIVILGASIIAGLLTFVIIGALLYPLIIIAQIVFSILGFLKAKDGIAYRYPVTIRFIK